MVLGGFHCSFRAASQYVTRVTTAFGAYALQLNCDLTSVVPHATTVRLNELYVQQQTLETAEAALPARQALQLVF